MFALCAHSTFPGRRGSRLLTAAVLAAVAAVAGAAGQSTASTPTSRPAATNAGTTQAAVEAETFVLPPADGQVFTDPAASGDRALLLWTTSTATATVTTAVTTAITIRVRGDQCQGAPLLRLSVDGAAAGTTAVTATTWTDAVFTGAWGAGTHQLAVSYLNDIAGQGCDRNLRIDKVTFTAAPSAPVRVEAEQMTLPAANGRPFTDPTASGGAGLLIWNNATATTTLSAPAGGHLVVRARGDACAGPAQMAVTVDARTVLTATVASPTWTDVAVPTPWPGGAHQVQVAFTNDFQGGGCDRNLRVDLLTVHPAPLPSPPPTPTAPPGHLFGLSSTGPDQGITTAQATAASIGRHLDVVNFYQAWVWNTPLPVTELHAIAAGGAEPEITWEPWDPRLGATQPAYALTAITGGAYDAYITGWARAAAAYGQPLLLRFAHEMNGTWYPWAPAVNGGTPAAYIAAYRHVHDLFTAAGATNVDWVWSPNITQGQPTALDQLYPGPGYVDLIGVDGYNGGTDVPYMGGWRTPQQVFAPTLQALQQLAPTVPIVINETGSSENGGNKPDWITQLVPYLASDPQVTGLIWFDFDTPGQADWRLATSTASLNAARTALSSW